MDDVQGTLDDFPNSGKNNKKKNSKMIMIFSTVLSVLAVALIGGGIYFAGNSKSVLIQSFGQLSNNLKNVLDTTVSDEMTKKIANSEKVTVKGSLALNSSFGNYAVKYNIANDSKAMNSFLDLALLVNDEELIGANVFANKENLYFKLKRFMDAYYFMSNEYLNFEEAKENKQIDYKKMIDTVVKDIKGNIDKKDIKSSKETIEINGKKVKTTKLTYSFTTERLHKIVLAILEDFKEDSLLEDLSRVSGLEKKEISDAIDNAIKSVKENTGDPKEFLFDYSVYYKGVNNVVKYELGDSEFVMSYVQNDNFKEFSAIINDEVDGESKLIVTVNGNDDKYDFDGSFVTSDSSVNLSVKGKYEKTGDNSKFDATLSIAGQSITLNGESKLLDKSTSKTETTLKVSFAGQELGTLVLNSEIDFNADIDTSVIENAKNIEDVTPEELEDLQNRIMSDPVISAFIQGLTGGINPSEPDEEF